MGALADLLAVFVLHADNLVHEQRVDDERLLPADRVIVQDLMTGPRRVRRGGLLRITRVAAREIDQEQRLSSRTRPDILGQAGGRPHAAGKQRRRGSSGITIAYSEIAAIGSSFHIRSE